MSQLVTINNVQIEQLTYDNQRVVTFAQVAEVHGVSVTNIHRAFQRNRERFVEGEDYIRLDFSEASKLVPSVQVSKNGLFLFTENGYLLLVKPLRDDVSWSVQKQMRDAYFAMKRITPPMPQSVPGVWDVLAGIVQAGQVHARQIAALEHDVAAIKAKTPPADRMTTKDFLRRYSKPFLPQEVLRLFNAACRRQEDPIRFTPQGYEYPWLYYTLETLQAAYEASTKQLSFLSDAQRHRHMQK